MPIPSVTVGQAVTQSETQAIIDGINAQGQRVIITTNTTWSIPASVYRFKVTLVGGGGQFGGAYQGGYQNSTQYPGLNGGDSPMCSKYISGVDPGTSIPITVGAAAAGPNQDGGVTSFGSYFQSFGGHHSNGPTQGGRGTHTGDIGHANSMYQNASGVSYGAGGTLTTPAGAGIVIIEW